MAVTDINDSVYSVRRQRTQVTTDCGRIMWLSLSYTRSLGKQDKAFKRLYTIYSVGECTETQHKVGVKTVFTHERPRVCMTRLIDVCVCLIL